MYVATMIFLLDHCALMGCHFKVLFKNIMLPSFLLCNYIWAVGLMYQSQVGMNTKFHPLPIDILREMQCTTCVEVLPG